MRWGLNSRTTVPILLGRESTYNFKDKFVRVFNPKSISWFKGLFNSVPGYSLSYAGRPGDQDLPLYVSPSKAMFTVCCTSVVSPQFVNEMSWTRYSTCVDFPTLGSVSSCVGRSKSLWTFLLPVRIPSSIFQHHNNLLLPGMCSCKCTSQILICSFLSTASADVGSYHFCHTGGHESSHYGVGDYDCRTSCRKLWTLISSPAGA